MIKPKNNVKVVSQKKTCWLNDYQQFIFNSEDSIEKATSTLTGLFERYQFNDGNIFHYVNNHASWNWKWKEFMFNGLLNWILQQDNNIVMLYITMASRLDPFTADKTILEALKNNNKKIIFKSIDMMEFHAWNWSCWLIDKKDFSKDLEDINSIIKINKDNGLKTLIVFDSNTFFNLFHKKAIENKGHQIIMKKNISIFQWYKSSFETYGEFCKQYDANMLIIHTNWENIWNYLQLFDDNEEIPQTLLSSFKPFTILTTNISNKEKNYDLYGYIKIK